MPNAGSLGRLPLLAGTGQKNIAQDKAAVEIRNRFVRCYFNLDWQIEITNRMEAAVSLTNRGGF
jgi:hypothetical protein